MVIFRVRRGIVPDPGYDGHFLTLPFRHRSILQIGHGVDIALYAVLDGGPHTGNVSGNMIRGVDIPGGNRGTRLLMSLLPRRRFIDEKLSIAIVLCERAFDRTQLLVGLIRLQLVGSIPSRKGFLVSRDPPSVSFVPRRPVDSVQIAYQIRIVTNQSLFLPIRVRIPPCGNLYRILLIGWYVAETRSWIIQTFLGNHCSISDII